MRLSHLLEALGGEGPRNFGEAEVLGISGDSRSVSKGYLFVAVRGREADGHEYVEEAVERGAVALVTEKPIHSERAANIVVEDSAKALAILSSRFFGDPAASLILCGVSGTNGKTSTAHLLHSVAERSGWGRMGIIGTIGHSAGELSVPAVHTTPEPVTLHQLLREMEDKGCRGVVMEVSSHAVRQQRTRGIDFEVGILTNVTRDHLDYHPTLEDYIAAKREFCESLAGSQRRKPQGTLVYSVDDPAAKGIGEGFAGRKVAVSTTTAADVFASDVAASLKGTRFTLHLGGGISVPVNLKLLGRFSVSNATLAAAGAAVLGIEAEGIKAGLEALPRVPGRFETLGGGELPLVVLDYCHTPDSVEMTLRFCRDLKPARLVSVFGCGGDRDRGKRPLIGRLAQELCDACFVTEDNPRTESLEQIIDDILSGMDRNSEGLHVVYDRREAIHQAIAQAQREELVVIFGKGHENYQIVGTERFYFSDREEAEKALKNWGQR